MIKYKRKERYHIDYSCVSDDYAILSKHGVIVDHGSSTELFSMMKRIQQADLDRGTLSLFSVRTRSIYDGIPDV